MVDQQEDKYKDVNKGKGEDIEICRYKKIELPFRN